MDFSSRASRGEAPTETGGSRLEWRFWHSSCHNIGGPPADGERDDDDRGAI
jgi:hypothetical protein